MQYGFEARQKELRRPGLGSEQDITDPLGPRGKRTIDTASFWLQDEWKVLDQRLTLTGGFRVEDNSQFGANVSPKASTVFALNTANRLRFAYGEGFRAPDISELFGQFSSFGFFAFVGNPTLEPERSHSYSLGWTHAQGRLHYSLDFFYNRFKEGIGFTQVNLAEPFHPFFEQFIPLLNPFEPLFTSRNLGSFDARGLNSSLTAALPFGFSTVFDYTLLDRVRVDGENPERDGERLIGLGNLRNSGFLKFAWNRRLRVGNRTYNLRANLRGVLRGREALAETSAFNQPSDPSRIGQVEFVPAYQIWNVYVSLAFPVSERTIVEPFIAINNITDFLSSGLEYSDGSQVNNGGGNPTAPVFREPGRTIRGGFRVRFGR